MPCSWPTSTKHKFYYAAESERIEELEKEFNFHSQKAQASETIARYSFINDLLYDTVTKHETAQEETHEQ